MNQRVMTSTGILLILLISLIFGITAILLPAPAESANFGICLNSPNLWAKDMMLMRGINLAGIYILALTLYLINKRFRLLRSSQPLWAFFFIPICCANSLVCGRWSGAPVVMVGVLSTIISLMESYKLRNATRNMFFAAGCLAIGSMFEYAFLAFVPALIIGGMIMKVMRFRELIATLMGLVAPYWILVGLGIVGLDDFHPLEITTIFTSTPTPKLFAMLIGGGVLLLTGLILCLNNGMKLYAGNSQIRSYNNVINIFGICAIAGIILDFNNYMAYMEVWSMWLALQFANLFSLWNIRRAGTLYWLTLAMIFAIGSAILWL